MVIQRNRFSEKSKMYTRTCGNYVPCYIPLRKLFNFYNIIPHTFTGSLSVYIHTEANDLLHAETSNNISPISILWLCIINLQKTHFLKLELS